MFAVCCVVSCGVGDRAAAKDEEMEIVVISGGITNLLYRVDYKGKVTCSSVLCASRCKKLHCHSLAVPRYEFGFVCSLAWCECLARRLRSSLTEMLTTV